MNIIVVSYGLVIASYLLFSVLLLTSWQGRELGRRLIISSLATVLWAGAVVWTAQFEKPSFLALYVPEIVRDAAWLLVVSGVAARSVSRVVVIVIHSTWALLLGLGILQAYLQSVGIAMFSSHALLIRGGLLLAFAGLVLLEQLYRNANPSAERALRYFVLGIGGLFAYDLFLFSQGELLQGINVDAWIVRGFVNVAMLPLLAIAIRRNPDWSLNIFVSRHVVFYTAAFGAVGAYLLLMAIGGYYVRIVGGSWGGIAQIFFFAGALVVLGTLMFSVALRRRVKVFISKHFYHNKYDYRIEWLRFIQTLSSSSGEDVRCTALRAIAQIIGSPKGVLFTHDETGQQFVASASWPSKQGSGMQLEVMADEEFVRFLAERQWIVDVPELMAAPSLYQNLKLPSWICESSEWRIILPMLELDRLVGFFVLAAPPPPFVLTYEDRDLLKTVGRHVATHVAQQEANKKLAESRQFEAYNRLTAFLMHDLKNAVAQLSLLVKNAERHKGNPEFIDDAIGTIANAAERMTRLIEQLQRGSSAGNERTIPVLAVVLKAVDRCTVRKPPPTAQLPDDQAFVVADAERLGMVLEHVIRNAQEATTEAGSVSVKVDLDAASVRIAIEDTGAGMDTVFLRERLFRPFDSTKGSRGMGIGAYQAREYVRSLGGDVQVTSSVGHGTRFTIKLPRAIDSKSSGSQLERSNDGVAATA